MKGRAITTKEYERMLSSVPKVVGKNLRHRTRAILGIAKDDVVGRDAEALRAKERAYSLQLKAVAESWQRLLWGLW